MGAAMADIEIALNKLCSCYNIKAMMLAEYIILA